MNLEYSTKKKAYLSLDTLTIPRDKSNHRTFKQPNLE